MLKLDIRSRQEKKWMIKMKPKSLKSTVLNQLNKLTRGQFLVLIVFMMAFILALLSPEIRDRFMDITARFVEVVCTKIYW